MPNKHNEDRRHHIAKKSMKLTSRAENSAGGLVQPHYSDIAIETNLLLRSAFRMPLRQAKGQRVPS